MRSRPWLERERQWQLAPARRTAGGQGDARAALKMKVRRCGTVGIAGRPNTGKSSLLNRLIGEKLSIVSAKPQTTRHSITGILTREDSQHIFVDAPVRQTQSRRVLHRAAHRDATE